jgi:hypothetical protein
LARHLTFSTWPYRDTSGPYSLALTIDWHGISQIGSWDVTKLVSDYGQFLRHSRQNVRASPSKRGWEEAVFVLSPDLWFALSGNFAGERELHVWTSSREKAEQELRRLQSKYLLPEQSVAEGDYFFVLMVSQQGVVARRVETGPFVLGDGDLELHYREGFRAWSRDFVSRLSTRNTGLSILQGPPGTGKTSYLRHLVHELRDTHRFYYVPVTVYPMLAASTTVDFWITENCEHSDKSKVAIIEDAETLLMERGSDNHSSLSNLLNIADGFLGSFLKLHVICTLNAAVDRLDSAILRPGRLLAHETFERLSAEKAEALASAKGLKILDQESYSLAEIYNADTPAAAARQSQRLPGFHGGSDVTV